MNYKPKNFKYGEIISESDLNNTQSVELIAIGIDIPENMQNGDNYYDSNDNLIYTMIDNELNDGEQPIEGVIYVLVAEETLYYYDGSKLISVGGGKPEVVIQDDTPTEEQNATIWIDTGEINNLGSEVVDSLEGNETNVAPSVRAVNSIIESGFDDMRSYTKFADGTMIQTVKTTVSNQQMTAFGSIYRTGTFQLDYFSQPFIGTPKVMHSITNNVNNYMWLGNTSSAQYNYPGWAMLFSATSHAEWTMEITSIAIGRWK